MRKRSIGCDILIGLLDCKLHTIQELAERAEVSYSTVFRYIRDLSISLPIETEHGRQGKRGGGGVRLLNKVFIERLFTAEEIRYIRIGLEKQEQTEAIIRLKEKIGRLFE